MKGEVAAFNNSQLFECKHRDFPAVGRITRGQPEAEVYVFEFQVFYGCGSCAENTEQPDYIVGETGFDVKSSDWRAWQYTRNDLVKEG